jgi:hypothetical protein
LTFDNRGKLCFTTPNNSRIGEFDPSRHKFLGTLVALSAMGELADR